MKIRLIISALLLASTGFVQAQFSFNDLLFGFDKNLFFTDVDAKIMYADGTIKENVKIFYHPVFMSNSELNLGEWKSFVDKEYESITIPKKGLKAIYVDGNTWVPRTDPSQGESWVAVTHWGAIERSLSFDHSESLRKQVFEEKFARELAKGMGAAYDEKEIQFAPAKRYQKLNEDPTYGSQIKVSFRKVMAAMTADYPELSAKIENKEKGYRVFDLEGVIQEYNQWYDEQNPGKLSSITDGDWGIVKAEEVTLKEAIASEELNPLAKMKKEKAAAKAKYEAKEASRPTAAPASIAPAKPNVPVKKESFTDKVARIKGDGNKIGVNFVNPYVYIKPPAASTGSTGMTLGGAMGGSKSGGFPADTTGAYVELKALAESFVKDMNAEFDTDVFELVEDVNQVPFRKMGSFLFDDWWATKYKMLLTYNISTYYDISKAGGKYSGFFRTNSTMTGTEFFLSKGKPRQKIIIITTSFGNYYKELTESADDNIKTISDIESSMNGTIEGKEIYDTLLAERKDSFEKFIAKRKK